MKILFVHQNFPGQFGALANHLASNPKNQVVALRSPPGREFPGVRVVPYSYLSEPLENQHPILMEQESRLLRAEAAVGAAKDLKAQGFTPDVIIAHAGWGEALFLKDVWPTAKLVGYMEYFYRAEGQDVGFDPEFSAQDEIHLRLLRWKNSANHLLLEQTDACVSPTQWQRSTYPEWVQKKIQVIHDGIDTTFFDRNPKASLKLAKSGQVLTPKDEVITYVSRFLEPIRGFHTFMRAVPQLLAQRPKAHVLILGGDDPGYMNLPEGYSSYKHMLLEELHHDLDPKRVHFLGVQPRETYRNVLQVSSAHVYLTYPFVLSWSMLEAMSCGARLFASDTVPVREFVTDGESGTLIEFSSEAIVQHVCRGFRSKRRLASFRQAARERIQLISREKSLAAWERLLERVLN